LTKIAAPQAWDITKGSGVKTAILDTGIDQDHPDLRAARSLPIKNFTTSPTVDDLFGHGTHVAGIVAATTNNASV